MDTNYKTLEDKAICPNEDCGQEFTESFSPFDKVYQGHCDVCGHTIDLHLNDLNDNSSGLSAVELELAISFLARNNLIKSSID